MTSDPASSNPLKDNPIQTRDDVERAVRDLFAPLMPQFSPGNARVPLDGASAGFDRAAAELEGFARPLWGLAPLAAGGAQFDHWQRFRDGLSNGTNPEHPEFWGRIGPRDQRLVELAAIGYALSLIPHLMWEPLSPEAKRNVARYLLAARKRESGKNNWLFFRVLIELGLTRCGIPFDPIEGGGLADLEPLHVGDGWYRDGEVRQMDHYVGFAFHYYSLILTVLSPDTPLAAQYRERAARFALDYRHWFDEDGGVLAFGRSLTYRFAVAGFWGALAYANVEALPWGEIKGHYMRQLRWWRDKPITHRDGVLSVGYGYPNLMMSEGYNSPASPYWAFKAFLPLALPATHPFWTAEELPAATATEPVAQRHPGMVLMQTPGNVVALASGQDTLNFRFAPEKYAKFVYASRYAFSVESDGRGFPLANFDGMLAFSDDEQHYRVRESSEIVTIAGDKLYSRWRPWPDVQVETWLIPASPWHIRVHRIRTNRRLSTIEGGFAIARSDFEADKAQSSGGVVSVRSPTDVSSIVDLDNKRRARLLARGASPNTNLASPRVCIPQLVGPITERVTILRTAAIALPVGRTDLSIVDRPPSPPDVEELERLFARDGIPVTVMQLG